MINLWLFKKHVHLYLLGAFSILVLANCGGGSNSNASTNPNVTGPNRMRIFVFGSSSSDAGTYQEVTTAIGVPTSGKFTVNPGPLWVENIATHFGITIGPNRLAGFGYGPIALGGTDYAEGGSRVALQPGSGNTDATKGPNSGASTLPVADQITHALADYGSFQNNDIILIWAGANDILGAINTADATTTIQQAADALVTQINRVIANGGRKIAVLNIPDLGKSPLHASDDPLPLNSATQLSIAFNSRLSMGLQGITNVVLVDIFSKFADLRSNPASYGLTNLTSPACTPYPNVTFYSIVCTSTSLAAPNADQTYMYADTLHLTPKTHRIISDFVLANIAGF